MTEDMGVSGLVADGHAVRGCDHRQGLQLQAGQRLLRVLLCGVRTEQLPNLWGRYALPQLALYA